jgi:hypothetical protein
MTTVVVLTMPEVPRFPPAILGAREITNPAWMIGNLESQFAAEYGRNSGSVVNLITRSGTNKLHGSAFEFLRNPALDGLLETKLVVGFVSQFLDLCGLLADFAKAQSSDPASWAKARR